MSGGEIEEARILDILLKLEAHIERVVEHEDRIRLPSAFKVYYIYVAFVDYPLRSP